MTYAQPVRLRRLTSPGDEAQRQLTEEDVAYMPKFQTEYGTYISERDGVWAPGSETYDRLRAINPEVKVLLSSGYSINGQATKILNRGCNGFIQKPFAMKELSDKIREILQKEA